MGHLGTDKDIEKIARKARKAGWTVEVTKGNHLRWTAPSGEFTITPLSSGSSRSRIYLLSSLRKAGLAL